MRLPPFLTLERIVLGLMVLGGVLQIARLATG